jgi:hypothetical protein
MIVAKYGHDKRRYASLAQEVTKVKRLRVGIKKAERPLKTLRLLHNYYYEEQIKLLQLLQYYNLLFFVG